MRHGSTLLTAIFFTAFLAAAEAQQTDRQWAESQATETASAEAILSQFKSLYLGESQEVRAFRSLFLDQTYEYTDSNQKAKRVRYLLFAPDITTPGEKRPLIVYLHGMGHGELDEHSHITMMARLFFPPPWQHNRYPFFFLSVLCPADNPGWLPDDRVAGDDLLEVVMAIIDQITHEFPIDTDRISVTGFSRGGFACWELVTRHPERFSAAAPIAARVVDVSRTQRLTELPIWAFHSTGDDVVPIAGVQQTVQALKVAGGIVHLTEFDSKDHDAWRPAYDDHGLLHWLVIQRRGNPPKYRPGTTAFEQQPRTNSTVPTIEELLLWILLTVTCVSLVIAVLRSLRRRRALLVRQNIEGPDLKR